MKTTVDPAGADGDGGREAGRDEVAHQPTACLTVDVDPEQARGPQTDDRVAALAPFHEEAGAMVAVRELDRVLLPVEMPP